MNAALLRYSAVRDALVNVAIDKRTKTKEYHAMDTTVAAATLLMITAATLGAISTEATEMVIFLACPLMGATLVTAGAVMLNPEIETRKITMGRAFFGFSVGVPGPWALISLLEYWGLDGLSKFFKLPPLLFLAGAAICLVAFIMSRPFCRGLYERSHAIARHEVRRLERMAGITDKIKEESESPPP